jgi:chromosome segregation ATPase
LDGKRESFFDLLKQAAHLAEEEIGRARRIAEELSRKLQSADAQIEELKADVRHYRDIADQAEKYLRLLLLERDQRAAPSVPSRSPPMQTRQPGPEAYAPPKYREG